MRLATLFSGGKDSTLAQAIAQSFSHEITCAITIESENKESYMFHTPNIDITKLQCEAMNIPQLTIITAGEKEEELIELKRVMQEAKDKYQIEGVITGAVGSQYQATRIQKICHELNLWCFNPLWQMDQLQLLNTLIQNNFEVIISGVFAYPFDESWLGKTITKEVIEELKVLQEKFQINPAGEGGEIETTVIDCPLFLKKINITKHETQFDNHAGTYTIIDAELKDKQPTKFALNTFNESQTPDISIISTCQHKLHELEFIRPITDIIKKENVTYEIISLDQHPKGKKIIISGTALKDNEYLNKQLQTTKPTLGICAGAQLLAKEQGEQLKQEVKIGPHDNHYYLHQQSTQEIIREYQNAKGVMYHPEVSDRELIRKFIQSR